MKPFLVALVAAVALGAVAYVASLDERVERPVAEVFATQGVRL